MDGGPPKPSHNFYFPNFPPFRFTSNFLKEIAQNKLQPFLVDFGALFSFKLAISFEGHLFGFTSLFFLGFYKIYLNIMEKLKMQFGNYRKSPFNVSTLKNWNLFSSNL